MGEKLVKIAVIYFLIGVALGLYMSLTHVTTLTPVHVHVNLLGWVSLALVGILYIIFPALAQTASAKTHFWLHNIGLPVMMISIAITISGGSPIFFPLAAIGGVITFIGILIFGYNVFRHLHQEAKT